MRLLIKVVRFAVGPRSLREVGTFFSPQAVFSKVGFFACRQYYVTEKSELERDFNPMSRKRYYVKGVYPHARV